LLLDRVEAFVAAREFFEYFLLLLKLAEFAERVRRVAIIADLALPAIELFLDLIELLLESRNRLSPCLTHPTHLLAAALPDEVLAEATFHGRLPMCARTPGDSPSRVRRPLSLEARLPEEPLGLRPVFLHDVLGLHDGILRDARLHAQEVLFE